MSDVREALHRAMDDLPVSTSTIEGLERSQNRRATRKRVAAGAVGAAITLAIVLGIQSLRMGSTSSPLEPAAGTVFQLTADQRYEREVRVYVLNDSGASVTEVTQSLSWGLDGRGSSSERSRQVFFDPADRAAYESRLGVETGWQAPGGPGTGNDTFIVADRHIPTDPAQLEQWLVDGHADVNVPALDGTPDASLGATDPGLWHLVSWDLLRDRTTSPAVRAAAVQVASELGGVQIDRIARDPAGRPAIALHTTSGPDVEGWQSVDEWIYADPKTLVPMALEDSAGVITLFATEQIVTTESKEVVQTFVPQLADDQLPFTQR